MREINLLEKSHPFKKKDIVPRTEENKIIAKRYDKEFFDGDRINGYGGYYYDGRWRHVVEAMQKLYGINENSAILDIGCGKGFLLYDLQEMIPGIKVAGIDISEYALNKAMDKLGLHLVKQQTGKTEQELSLQELEQAKELEQAAKDKVLPHIIMGSADQLPWPDNSFDVVISIDTIHNLPKEKCAKAIKEMMRVCKPNGNMFIKVDSYRNEEEKQRLEAWALTAETAMHADDWINFFKEQGYDGDYYWTII